MWPALIAVLVVAAVAVELLVTGGGTRNGAGPKAGPTTAPTSPPTTAKPAPPPKLRTSLLGWRLPVPISQPIVLPGPGDELVVIGGLTASGTSGDGAFLLSTSNGSLRLCADLAAGVHDASGAVIGEQDFVFGGMASTVTASVQSFPAPSSPPASPSAGTHPEPSTSTTAAAPTATATVSLPQPRAGSATVMIGTSAYVVGGSRGTAADGDVLATSDGSNFSLVAHLPVPVRNPAVAAVGGEIYVFGGATTMLRSRPAASARPSASAAPSTSTTLSWAPVAAIQRVDPVTGQATIIGHLPTPLQGAVAVTLDGHIYVAGGQGPSGANALVWGFEPDSATVVVAGRLREAVSGAGAATLGSTAWLVGGESGGDLVGSVQALRPVPSSAPPPVPGSSRPSATSSTSLPPAG